MLMQHQLHSRAKQYLSQRNDTKVHSHSVDPQKNCRNYLITHSILKFPTPRRPSLQRRSFDIYISAVGPKNKKLAVLL